MNEKEIIHPNGNISNLLTSSINGKNVSRNSILIHEWQEIKDLVCLSDQTEIPSIDAWKAFNLCNNALSRGSIEYNRELRLLSNLNLPADQLLDLDRHP